MSSTISPSTLETTPAGPPPPGVTSNLIDPPTENAIFFGINSTLMVVMFLFLGLRIQSKFAGHGTFWWDDYVSFVGATLTTSVYIEYAYIVTECKFGTHIWNVSAALIASKKFAIGTWLSSWPTNLAYIFVKDAFFLMYINVFGPFKWMRIASWVGLLINTGAYFAIFVVTLYSETPSGTSWQNAFSQSKYSIAESTAIPIAVIGLVIDLAILILPIAGISRLRMSTKKRYGLSAVFATGLCAVVCSVLALYYRVQLTKTIAVDLTWAIFPVYVVTCTELQIGVICSSMPACAGHLHRYAESFPIIWEDLSFSGIVRLVSTGLRSSQRSQHTSPQRSNEIPGNRSRDQETDSTKGLRSKTSPSRDMIDEEHELEDAGGVKN